ncbi:PREDICTED: ankyrin repeat and MYND domain-containing protein 1 [Elephantulus edwardii]|uniref:ankyrin repeat and MYND domain-containing protein 1 n=1 Tax=Elephantulus edwardii TaxID=28737 RepID=UPI0003F06301|nr:PREDICTED: ankyrin repeat and MYND domain-containing protein 1 [Elephantulus edwardii]
MEVSPGKPAGSGCVSTCAFGVDIECPRFALSQARCAQGRATRHVESRPGLEWVAAGCVDTAGSRGSCGQCPGAHVCLTALPRPRVQVARRGMDDDGGPRSFQEPLTGPGSEPRTEDLNEQEDIDFSKWGLSSLDAEDEKSEGPPGKQDLKETYIHLVQGSQEWHDGCTYLGEFGLHTKTGLGEFSWPTGETYRGHLYHDHLHGLGTYTWPDGSSFTGTFYLSRREGYGTLYLKTRLFQGLYKADRRFGPGVETNPDGSQDVGLWFHEHLVKLCWQAPHSFSVLRWPELAHFVTDAPAKLSLSDKEMEWDWDEARDPFFYEYKKFLLNDDLRLPPDMPLYSTDNSHLPMTCSFRKDLEAQLFMDDDPHVVEDGEPWPVMNETPLLVRILKHTYKFRHDKAHASWNMAAIVQGDRSGFARCGFRERVAREMILKAEDGDYDWIHGILRKNLASADVADAQGYTVLAAAAVHGHTRVINLLLDSGADVNRSSDEGLTPLSMCFLLYYPASAFKPNIAERNLHGALLEHQEVSMRLVSNSLTRPARSASELASHQGDSHQGILNQTSKLSREQISPSTGPQSSLQTKTNVSRSLQGPDDKTGNTLSSDITFESNVCVHNLSVTLSPDFLERSAHLDSLFLASSLTTCDSEKGSIRKRVLSIMQHKRKWQTIQLLLRRGADPNLCRVPMQVLFFAVRAADVDAVRLLLEYGAQTDIRFPPQLRSLTPLHIAAALPGEEGVQITELLLQAITDVNAQASDQDEVYRPHKVELLSSSLKLNNEPGPPSSYYTPCPPAPEGGRTALHVVCEREDDSKHTRDIVRLLLTHKANPNTLWSGHSPLSLSITNGNDLVVKELLVQGADPNLPLTKGLGNALCMVCDLVYDHHRSIDSKLALVDRLISSGADILYPITITQGDKVAVGTAVDYGYFRFFQDRKIAHCPFHTLMPAEREILLARKRFLEYLGVQLRRTVFLKEGQWDSNLLYQSKKAELSSGSRIKKGSWQPKCPYEEGLELIPIFKFCYQCGRSVGVRLLPCIRCYGILTCSKFCKTRAWNEFHKQDCCATLAMRKLGAEGPPGILSVDADQPPAAGGEQEGTGSERRGAALAPGQRGLDGQQRRGTGGHVQTGGSRCTRGP